MSWSSLLLLFCHVSTLTHIYRHFKYEIPSEWCRHHGAVCLVPLGCQLPNVRPCSIKQRIQPIFDLSRVHSFEAAKQILLLLTLQARGNAGSSLQLWGLSLSVGPTWSNHQIHPATKVLASSNQRKESSPKGQSESFWATKTIEQIEQWRKSLKHVEKTHLVLSFEKSALEDHCDKSCSVKWVATQGSCMFSNAYSLPTISCSQNILPCDANDPHVRRQPSSLVLLLKLCLETFD